MNMVPMVHEAYMINMTGKDGRIFENECLISRKNTSNPFGMEDSILFKEETNTKHFEAAGIYIYIYI